MQLRALLFDDNDAVRLMLVMALRAREYDVYDFSDPSRCPVYLDKNCPCPVDQVCGDLIITDVDMPKINGLDFVENQLRRGCKVKNIAVMSGDWTEAGLARARELGCKILYKPFNLVELENWLDQCEKNTEPGRKYWDGDGHKRLTE